MNIHSTFVITLLAEFFVTAHASQPAVNLDLFNSHMRRCIKKANRHGFQPHLPNAHSRSHEDFDITGLMQLLQQNNTITVKLNNAIHEMHTKALTEKIFELYINNAQYANNIDLTKPDWMHHYFPTFALDLAKALEYHQQN